MASNVQKVIRLIDTLTPDEKKFIFRKMKDEINEKLLDTLDERTEKRPTFMGEKTKAVEEV